MQGINNGGMQRKIVYLINPISGTKDKGALIALIKRNTVNSGIPFIIENTDAAGKYDFLIPLIDKEKITDVVVCGGDGSVNQVAAALQGINVNIGIIPMGSGNGLAYAAKIPMDVEKALQIIFTGAGSFIDSFQINKQFSCMLCGLGFDAQVAHDFAKQPTRGLLSYAKQTVKNFISAKTFPFTIIEKTTEIKTHAYFISIANSNQFGNNVRIAPQASLNDGLLDVVVVNKMSKLKMLYKLLVQIKLGQVIPFSKKTFRKQDIHYFQTNRLTILNPGNAPLHIDGEPCAFANNYEIEMIPNSFKLLQP